MPGGKATKPGDVVKAMNGKTIQVINLNSLALSCDHFFVSQTSKKNILALKNYFCPSSEKKENSNRIIINF